MITTSAGGCTTAFPFEAAIWLLEEQEELYGGTFPVRTSTMENLAAPVSLSTLVSLLRLTLGPHLSVLHPPIQS